MAIYHLSAKIISRSQGRSSVGSAAYRRAAMFRDERQGKNFDYSKKKNVIHSEILIPNNSPDWLRKICEFQRIEPQKASEQFWNSVEKKENRVDSELAREIEFALPLELNKNQCIDLAREFLNSQFTSQGMVADFSIHWEEHNPHVHVMLSTRELKMEGFGNKIRTWRDKSLLFIWRRSWAELVNQYLAREGLDIRIDHRSYIEQGIDLLPTKHEGIGRHLQDKGLETHTIQENKVIRLINSNKIIENPEIILDKLAQEKNNFTVDDIKKSIESYKSANESSIQKPLWKGTSKNINELLQGLEKNESVFTDKNLRRVVAKYSDNLIEINKIIEDIKSSPNLLPIGPGNDGRERYTTRAMFDLENHLQKLSGILYRRNKHAVKNRIIERSIKKFNLKDDQAEAIRHVLKGPDVTAIVGRAGTGKSYSLKVAADAWTKAGYKVQGIALAGIAASNMQIDSGINSKTIASFTLALKENRLTLSKQDIVIMDEAGMTDSSSFHDVLVAVKRAKAKLVLVGDHAQLQPVGPGAPFRALLERIGFSELTTIRRQEQSWQREATSKFAQGKIGKALDAYHRNKCIEILDNPNKSMEKLIDDWQQTLNKKDSTLDQTLILAYRNIDVDSLNLLARDRLVNQSSIDAGSVFKTIKGDISVSIGERLLFLENNEQVGVKNGNRGTVTKIERNTITVKLDGKENEIDIDTSKYNKFTYGYACTVHRSQGVTVDKSFVFAAGNWVRNLTYVAMSRHRKSVKLYANKETHKDFISLKKSMSRQGIKDSILDYPLAFSVRRGIDIEKIAERVKKHIQEKLSEIKNTVKNTVQKILIQKTNTMNFDLTTQYVQLSKQRNQLAPPWLKSADIEKKEWRDLTSKMELLADQIIKDPNLSNIAKESGILKEIHKFARYHNQHLQANFAKLINKNSREI